MKVTVFEPPNTLRCTRCGTTMTLKVPVSIKALEFYLKGFEIEHAHPETR